MLVLERKLREVITIGPDITIEVLEIRHGRKPKVRLGISAPRSLAIDRPDARVRVPRREPARATGSANEIAKEGRSA